MVEAKGWSYAQLIWTVAEKHNSDNLRKGSCVIALPGSLPVTRYLLWKRSDDTWAAKHHNQQGDLYESGLSESEVLLDLMNELGSHNWELVSEAPQYSTDISGSHARTYRELKLIRNVMTFKRPANEHNIYAW